MMRYVQHQWMHPRIDCKEFGKKLSLLLDHSPINTGGQTNQSLGWPHPVSIYTWAWPLPVTWQRSSIAENPMLHANFRPTALSSIEPDLLLIKVLRCGNSKFRAYLLLWPWPWPDDLHMRTWHVSPRDVPTDRKRTFYTSRLSKVIVLHSHRYGIQ